MCGDEYNLGMCQSSQTVTKTTNAAGSPGDRNLLMGDVTTLKVGMSVTAGKGKGVAQYSQITKISGKTIILSKALDKPVKKGATLTFDVKTLCDSTSLKPNQPTDQCSEDPELKTKTSLYKYFLEIEWILPDAYMNGAPSTWSCPNDFFEAWDGICDCNCGAWDPDCGTIWNPPQEVRGCSDGYYCSLAGTCMYGVDNIDIYYQGMDDNGVQSSTGVVLVSYDCDFLKMPGNEMVVGFVGDADNNTGTYHSGPHSVSKGGLAPCGSCPGDELFDFTAQKNEDGNYVCNMLAEGSVNSGSEEIDDEYGVPVDTPIPNFIDNPDVDTAGQILLWKKDKDQKSKTASMQMVVNVGESTPFPAKDQADQSKFVYKVIVGAGDGNAEILNVTACTPVVDGKQTMTVSKVTGSGSKRKFKKPKFNHVMQGVLAGAFTPSSTEIFVLPGEYDFCGITNAKYKVLDANGQPAYKFQPVALRKNRLDAQGQPETDDNGNILTEVIKYPQCGSAPRPEKSCAPTDPNDYFTDCWTLNGNNIDLSTSTECLSVTKDNTCVATGGFSDLTDCYSTGAPMYNMLDLSTGTACNAIVKANECRPTVAADDDATYLGCEWVFDLSTPTECENIAGCTYTDNSALGAGSGCIYTNNVGKNGCKYESKKYMCESQTMAGYTAGCTLKAGKDDTGNINGQCKDKTDEQSCLTIMDINAPYDDLCDFKEQPCTWYTDREITFDEKGPYTISVNDETATVVAATQLTRDKNTDAIKGSPFQKLTIGTNNLENSVGMSGVLQQPAQVGDTSVMVTSAGFGKKSLVQKMKNPGDETPYAILSFGNQVLEVALADSTLSAWNCDKDWYNDGQYCDCGCGIYDPDCGLPSKSDEDPQQDDHPDYYFCEGGPGQYNNPSYCAYTVSGDGLCVGSQPSDNHNYQVKGKCLPVDPLSSQSCTISDLSTPTECLAHTYPTCKYTYEVDENLSPVQDSNSGVPQCDAASLKSAKAAETSVSSLNNIAVGLLPRCSNALHTETVTFKKPLTLGFPALSILETSIYEEVDYWCYDPATGCGTVKGFDPVTVAFKVKMYRPGRTQFFPKHRHLPSLTENTRSPESLTADVALFLVPDRPTFAEADLCPKLLEGSAAYVNKAWNLNGWDKWTINQGRGMTVECSPIVAMNASLCETTNAYKSMYKGQYRATCISDLMPPTYLMKYSNKKPINNIWTIPSASGLGRDDPMWFFEIAHRYTFAHDDMDDEAENSMAARGRSTGDFLEDQSLKPRLYTGAVNYRGTGTMESETQMIPANNPFLRATATVNFADIAAAEIIKCEPKWYPMFYHEWYEKAMLWILDIDWIRETVLKRDPIDVNVEVQKILDKLEPLTVTWDTSTVGGSNGQVLLKPGYRYIMTASVGIFPIYRQTQYFGFTYIDGFGTALEGVDISTEKLGYLEKTDALVIFQVTILDNLSQMIIQHNSSVDLLSAQFGAAIAYLGIGMFMLKYWQMMTCQNKKNSAWAHIKQNDMNSSEAGPKEAEGDADGAGGAPEVTSDVEAPTKFAAAVVPGSRGPSRLRDR
jgi:hypothetical protein